MTTAPETIQALDERFTQTLLNTLKNLNNDQKRIWSNRPDALERLLGAALAGKNVGPIPMAARSVQVDWNADLAALAEEANATRRARREKCFRIMEPSFLTGTPFEDPRRPSENEVELISFLTAMRNEDLEPQLLLGNWRPAEPLEVITLCIKHPQVYNRRPVVSLRQLERSDGHAGFLFIYETDEEVRIDIRHLLEGAWSEHCLFAVVKTHENRE